MRLHRRIAFFVLCGSLVGCGGVDPSPKIHWDDCVTCHLEDFERAQNPPHQGVYPQRCSFCHGRSAWRPMEVGNHDEVFPISSGKHRKLTCEQCHPQPRGYLDFSCVTCKEHAQDRMDRKHHDEGGYRYESTACLRCHPGGRE